MSGGCFGGRKAGGGNCSGGCRIVAVVAEVSIGVAVGLGRRGDWESSLGCDCD